MKSTARHHAAPRLSSAALATALACHPALAATYTVLHRFTGVDGAQPQSEVTLDHAGNIYGMAQEGGAFNYYGVIFKNDAAGRYTVLHSFNGNDGQAPGNNVLTLMGATLYGATTFGGPTEDGVLFSMHTDGSAYTLLHAFNGKDGYNPIGKLIPLRGGGLVGVTYGGGPGFSSFNSTGLGVLFGVSDTGVFHRLYTFSSANGEHPNAVLPGPGHTVIGSTYSGGGGCSQQPGCGVIYQFDASTLVYTVLHRFTGQTDGFAPMLGSVGPDGTLYGKATSGAEGLVFALTPSPAGYQFTLIGKSTLAAPTTGPTLGKQGGLIGAAMANYHLSTQAGGLYRFKNGKESFTEVFTGVDTGLEPVGQPALDGTGVVYGTTYTGGTAPCITANGNNINDNGCGVLYRYDPR